MNDRSKNNIDLTDTQKKGSISAEEQLGIIRTSEIYYKIRSKYEAAKSKRLGFQLMAYSFVIGAAFLSCSLPESYFRNIFVFVFAISAIIEAFISLESANTEADAAIDLRQLAPTIPASDMNSPTINADRGANIIISNSQLTNYYWPPIPSHKYAHAPIVLAIAIGLREINGDNILTQLINYLHPWLQIF